MKIQEVILRAVRGALTWLQPVAILGMNPRSLRRWRDRYQPEGYDCLLDRRRRHPRPRRAPFAVHVRASTHLDSCRERIVIRKDGERKDSAGIGELRKVGGPAVQHQAPVDDLPILSIAVKLGEP